MLGVVWEHQAKESENHYRVEELFVHRRQCDNGMPDGRLVYRYKEGVATPHSIGEDASDLRNHLVLKDAQRPLLTKV